MVEKLKALLVPPAYPEDEDKTRVARLLHIILSALVILLTFDTVVAGVLTQDSLAISLNLAAVIITAVLFTILHLGYVRPAAILTVSLYWAAVAAISVIVTGFSSIIVSSFFVLVFLSGVLINKRAAILFAVLSIIAAAIAYQAGMQGSLLAATPKNPVVDISATAVNLLIMAIIIYLNQQTLENALNRSRQSQRALEAYQTQLENRVAQRTRDLALANEVGRTVQTMRDQDKLLSSAIRVIQSYFNLYLAQIYLLNDEGNTLVLRAAEGQAAERLLRQEHFLTVNAASINGRAAFEKRPQIVSDTKESPIFRPHPLLPLTRSEMAVPLKVADRVLGVLDLQSTDIGAFSEENLPAFEALAGQLAIAMENAQLFTERQQSSLELEQALARAETQATQLALINELSTALENNSQALSGILDISAHYLPQLMPGTLHWISLWDEADQSVRTISLNGSAAGDADAAAFPFADALVRSVIEENQITRLDDEADLAAFADLTVTAAQPIRSVLLAPLASGPKAAGTLNLASERPSAFTAVDDNLVLQVGNLLATHIESQRLKSRVQRLAALVETHPDLIGIITTDGKTTYVNAAGLAMLGLPHGYPVSQIAYSDFFSTEDNRLILKEGLPGALEQGVWTGQVTLHRRDGTAVPADVTVAPNYDVANEPVGFSVTLRDISDRVQAIDAQRQLSLQLEERLLQVNALQRTMTHEGWAEFLTSPNRLIQGFMYDNEQIRLLSQRDLAKPETPQLAANGAHADDSVVAKPMLVRGETIGILGARNPSGAPLDADQQEMLAVLSSEVAEALERARLFEEMELARQQVNDLFTGSERVVRAGSLAEVLHALVDSTPLKRLERANILFFDKPWGEVAPNTLTITAVWEKSRQSAPIPVGTQFALEQFPSIRQLTPDGPVIFSDVNHDPRLGPDLRQFTEQMGASSLFFFPLVVGDQWFGILSAISTTPVTFTEEEIRQTTSLVDQAAAVSQTQQLFQQARDRARREQILREVTARVYAAADAESVLRTAAKEVNRVLGLDAFVYLDEGVAEDGGSNGRHQPEDQTVLTPEKTK